VHKAIKVLQPGKRRKRRTLENARGYRRDALAFGHWRIIGHLWANFDARRDRRLGFAVLGAELGLAGGFGVEHLDYCHPYVRAVFDQFENADVSRLMAYTRRLRRSNWGWLPSGWRYRAICYGHQRRQEEVQRGWEDHH